MLSKKSNVYLIISLALTMGVLTDYLFYQKSIGISFFIFNLFIIIFSLILIRGSEIKVNKIQVFILAAVLLFSAGVFWRASSFLMFFNFWGSVYLLFFFFALFPNKDILNYGCPKYFVYPLSFFLKSFGAAGKFIEKYKDKIPENKKFGSKNFRSVVKGVIIAAPFLIILGWLLSSADLVFRAYVGKIFNFNFYFNPEIILRALIILVASYVFLGVFLKIVESREKEKLSFRGEAEKSKCVELAKAADFSLLRQPADPFEMTKTNSQTKSENKSLGSIESSTVLVLIELLFLSFIAIQFFYLFGGKDYVWGIEEYITYAQYAKKGFYELIAASVLSFFLIYGLDKSGFRKNYQEKKIFKILSAVLVLEMSVIIYSAWTRMAVYVDGYGLTLSRFLVFAFLFWIFLVFIIFLYKKIFQEKKEGVFLFSIFCLSIIFWAEINLINPDAFIAKENIKKLEQGTELDPFYLSRLSDDAMLEIVKVFQLEIDEEMKMELASNLYHQRFYFPELRCYGDFYKCEPVSFKKKLELAEKKQDENRQSFNMSEKKALLILKENYKKIAEYQSKYFKKQAEECWESVNECEEKYREFGCGEERCEMYEKNAMMDR